MKNPFLARLERLTRLSPAALGLIERATSAPVTVAPDREIMAEGVAPDRLHIVVDGWGARVKQLRDGRQQFVALLFAGEVCDLDGYYLGSASDMSVALTACSVVTIGHADLRAAILAHPEIGQALAWLACVENSIMSEWIVGAGRRSARERLAHLLCELRARLGAIGRTAAGGFVLPITQEDIADTLGLTAVHVNRTLGALRQEGLLERGGANIESRDWDALARAGGFAPRYLHLGGMPPARA